MTDLDRERADLNALTREAHECIKDLHAVVKTTVQLLDRADAVRKDFEQVMQNFEDKVEEVAVLHVKELFDKVATEQVDNFIEQLMGTVKETETAINGRFDRLTKLLMFEEPGGERIQGLTLPDYIQAVADYNNGIPVKSRDGAKFTYEEEKE